MKYPYFIAFFLAILFMTSCEECDIFPVTNPYETGDTLWIHNVPGSDSLLILIPGNKNISFALGKDGDVYYGVAGGTLYWTPARIIAVNKEDGSTKWISQRFESPHLNSEIVIGDDGTVYVICNTILYALNPDNGTTKWKWEVPVTVPHPDFPNGIYTYGPIGALALTNDGDLVLGSIGAGVYSRGLYRISKNGTMNWYNLDANGGGISTGITIGKNGNLFYYSEIAGKLSLVSADPTSGDILWSNQISRISAADNNIAADDDGSLICSFAELGDPDMHLYRIDASSGATLWKSTFISSYWSKLIGQDGFIYQVVDRDVEKNGIHRINPANNEKQLMIWGSHAGALDNKNRIVYAFRDEGHQDKLGVLAIDGTIEWQVGMTGIIGNDFLVSDDKVIYGATGYQQIFAIQGDATLATSGWPKSAHGNRNTSNVNK